MITRAPDSRAIAWAWRTRLRVRAFTGDFSGFFDGMVRFDLDRDAEHAEVVEIVGIALGADLLELHPVLASVQDVGRDRQANALGGLVLRGDVPSDVVDRLAVDRA